MIVNTFKFSKPNDKSAFVKILFALLFYRSVATERQVIFHVGYWDKYVISIIACLLLFLLILIEKKGKFTVPKNSIKLGAIFITPMLFAWAYSMIILVLQPVEYSGMFTRSLSNLLFTILAILQAFLMYLYFGKKGINIIFDAYTASFVTSMLISFVNFGLYEFASMIFDSSFNGSVLEMSELTPTFCIFLIYYLYDRKVKNNNRNSEYIRILISILILIIGMKRILILATLIVVALYLFLKGREKYFNSYVNIFIVLILFVSYLYVFSIRSSLLFDLFEILNVNTMSRMQIWKGLNTSFNYSITYLGKGIGYTSKWMDNNWRTLGINGLTQTTGAHNDILKNFIDLGFIGSGCYYFLIFKRNTMKIKKLINNNAAILYFLMMLFQLLCWFTDNISAFHVFLWPFYYIIFTLLLEKRGIINNESKISDEN